MTVDTIGRGHGMDGIRIRHVRAGHKRCMAVKQASIVWIAMNETIYEQYDLAGLAIV